MSAFPVAPRLLLVDAREPQDLVEAWPVWEMGLSKIRVTLPVTNMETQKGLYKDYNPFNGGLYGFPC